jgi:hypothetical protein
VLFTPQEQNKKIIKNVDVMDPVDNNKFLQLPTNLIIK